MFRKLLSAFLDRLDPRRPKYRAFCRWLDDIDRALEDRDFYKKWIVANPTEYTSDGDSKSSTFRR